MFNVMLATQPVAVQFDAPCFLLCTTVSSSQQQNCPLTETNVSCRVHTMTDKIQRIKEAETLKERMRVAGITPSKMCRELGMSRATLYKWLKGGDRLQSTWKTVNRYVEEREGEN